MKFKTILILTAFIYLPVMTEEYWEKIAMPAEAPINENTFGMLWYMPGPYLSAGQPGHLAVLIDTLLCETRDNGDSWKIDNISQNYSVGFIIDENESIQMCPGPCYYSPEGVLYSTSSQFGGQAAILQDTIWVAIDHKSMAFSSFVAAAFGPEDDIYLGFGAAGIIHKDAEHEWEDITSGTWFSLPTKTLGDDLSGLVVDTSGSLYASYTGYRGFGGGSTGGGIAKITDHGAVWDTLTKEMPDTSYTALYFDHNQRLFTGIEGYGVYISLNFGSSWTSLNMGLTDSSVVNFVQDADNNLYVLTKDGIYQLKNTATAMKPEIPIESGKFRNLISFQTESFNSRVKISWEHSGKVTLVEIYNSLGQRVKTFDDFENNSVVWNAHLQPPGIYFAKVRTGRQIFMRKMVLQK